MSENTQQIAELIQKAIEVEKNGLRTYLQFARETGNPSGKNMFILLAGDELEHMDLLEKMLKDLMKSSDVVLPETVDFSPIEKIVPKIDKKHLATVGKAEQDELMALKTARQMEKNAIDYYEKLYEKVEAPELRRLVRRLVEMEEGHYNLVQMEIDSITNTGFWFDMMEFSTEH